MTFYNGVMDFNFSKIHLKESKLQTERKMETKQQEVQVMKKHLNLT